MNSHAGTNYALDKNKDTVILSVRERTLFMGGEHFHGVHIFNGCKFSWGAHF